MFDKVGFISCVQEGLKAKGFGHKRIKEITTDFEARIDAHMSTGKDTASAGVLAMRELFDEMSVNAQNIAKRNAKMLAVQADNIKRVQAGANVTVRKKMMDGGSTKGAAYARGAVSLIEDDPRFGGMSYSGTKETIRQQLYALFGDTLSTLGKGVMGRQRGKAHIPNIAREVFGNSTGDASARAMADAWLKIQDLTVDLFNAAGGTMTRLERYLPQSPNSVKIAQAGEARWVQVHMDGLDWGKTRWPDGKMIAPQEREGFLKAVYKTQSTDGASKIDVTMFRGRGKAVGNATDNHRLMHYKDGDAWLNVHNEFGDGNVFDVLVRHIEDMSHKIALVETFGPNPEMTALNLSSIVRKEAANAGPRELAEAEAVLKNIFDPMFETVTRQNPMDPHSTSGALVVGTANILTSAQLGSAALLAIPGDFMQTVAVRALNGMNLFGGVSTYVKSMLEPVRGMMGGKEFQKDMATQSGFVMDEVVMATYAASRWTGVATVGPALSRHVSEATMRLSLMSGHTRSARWSVQHEFMGALHRLRDTAFDDLPIKGVAERYGITALEWDAVRGGLTSWQPKPGVNMMRPIDILKTDLPNAQALYQKFQGMIFEESRKMVPEATIEGAVKLKSTTRPDTLLGVLAYSFAMYKNFPVSFLMIYGRLGMTADGKLGRLGFYAGLGAGMTLVGALGTQMREISRGRDPLPMDNPAFLGKAFLSGGALSIWGDFLFSGVNQFGAGPKDVAAGPLVSFLGDTTSLVLGDVFQFADAMGGLSDKEFKSTTAAKAVEYARRYTPGTSIWWARLVLEREVFDKLQLLADPKGRQKQARKVSKQKKDRGNEYWWKPGTDAPQRSPQFGG